VLLIGDRAIEIADCGLRIAEFESVEEVNSQSAIRNPKSGSDESRRFIEVWDLGERWSHWTGLPFVFAMWIARPGIVTTEIAELLTAARDQGVRHLQQIADRESPALEISSHLASRYLRDNLHFALGRKEREGLRRFYRLCVSHQLVPPGLESQLDEIEHGCVSK
jgi:predicted solute-binding protein